MVSGLDLGGLLLSFSGSGFQNLWSVFVECVCVRAREHWLIATQSAVKLDSSACPLAQCSQDKNQYHIYTHQTQKCIMTNQSTGKAKLVFTGNYNINNIWQDVTKVFKKKIIIIRIIVNYLIIRCISLGFGDSVYFLFLQGSIKLIRNYYY